LEEQMNRRPDKEYRKPLREARGCPRMGGGEVGSEKVAAREGKALLVPLRQNVISGIRLRASPNLNRPLTGS
jgi:hypothetical protein